MGSSLPAATRFVWACALLACTPATVTPPERKPEADEPDAAVKAKDARPADMRTFMLADAAPSEVLPQPTGKVLVYAHSGSDLFKVDPETLAIERVGNLVLKMPDGKMKYLNDVTDIAVDRDGHIMGVRFSRNFGGMEPSVGELLKIDSETAECTKVADLPPDRSFNGLSWIRTADGGEYLAATTRDGGLFRIDPTTGAATLVGPFGPQLGSSGDIVSVTGFGTLATLTGVAPGADDRLATIDPAKGTATVIGPITGFKNIYGIGFWGSRVFGFTDKGQLILINPKTAAAQLMKTEAAYPFYGAGVTTSVPVIFE